MVLVVLLFAAIKRLATKLNHSSQPARQHFSEEKVASDPRICSEAISWLDPLGSEQLGTVSALT